MTLTVVRLAEPARGVERVELDTIAERVGWVPESEREIARLRMALALAKGQLEAAREENAHLRRLVRHWRDRALGLEAAAVARLARLSAHDEPGLALRLWAAVWLRWCGLTERGTGRGEPRDEGLPRWAWPSVTMFAALAAALVRW